QVAVRDLEDEGRAGGAERAAVAVLRPAAGLALLGGEQLLADRRVSLGSQGGVLRLGEEARLARVEMGVVVVMAAAAAPAREELHERVHGALHFRSVVRAVEREDAHARSREGIRAARAAGTEAVGD